MKKLLLLTFVTTAVLLISSIKTHPQAAALAKEAELTSHFGQTALPTGVDETSSTIYQEDFTSYLYRDSATTADWNISEGILRLPAKDGVQQQDPSVVIGADHSTIVAWSTDNAVYAHKYDAQGNPLWLQAIQVNVGGLVNSGPSIAIGADGNVVIVWMDERNGHWDVYAQKLHADGWRMWGSDRLISVGNGPAPYYPVKTPPVITADGDTFFVVWHDYRGGWDIYAQQIDNNGNRLWTSDRRVNRDNPGENRWPHAASKDGLLTVVWKNSANNSLLAQQLDSNGLYQWANDVLVSLENGSSVYSRVSMGANGGSAVVWEYSGSLYLQRLTIDGQRVWHTDLQIASVDSRGIAVSELTSGGVVIAWRSADGFLYAQQVNEGAEFLWPEPFKVNGMGTAVYWYSIGMSLTPTGQIALTWVDDRTLDQDIYLQQFTTDKQIIWSADRRVNSASGAAAQVAPDIATGPGYHVLSWIDFRNTGDVYLQKVDNTGAYLWSNDIRANVVQGQALEATSVALAPDGSLVVVWVDARNGGEDVFMQRFDANGNKLWDTERQVNTIPGSWVLQPNVALTSAGEIVITWWSNRYIYAQKLDMSGQQIWDADVQVRYANDYDMDVDNSGNVLITWWEYRHGSWPEPPDIFLQKINAEGSLQWGEGGVEVDRNSAGWHLYPSVAVASDNTIWVAWSDAQSTDGDIYLQRLSNSGVHLWNNDVSVNDDSTGQRQEHPQIVMDSNGNAFITWRDYRNDTGDYRHTDLYAQSVSSTGARLWADDIRVNQPQANPVGFFVATLGNYRSVTWVDYRDIDPTIYLQSLNANGNKNWVADINAVQDDNFYFDFSIAESRTIDLASENITAATITANYLANGGSVEFFLSNDGGENWADATLGTAHIFTTTGSDLRWRVVLQANPLWWNRTPIINALRIEYETTSVTGDIYELDDNCSLAQPIQLNSVAQQHTFHQYEDSDWVWFDGQVGTTYVIQTSNTAPRADTVLELYGQCGQPPNHSDDNAFGPGVTLVFVAPATGRYYVRVLQSDGNVYGEGTEYDLSVRTQSTGGAAIVVAGRQSISDPLQPIIEATGDLAYQSLLQSGLSPQNIQYLSTATSLPGVDGLSTKANVRNAIQDWARTRVGPDTPLWIYLADHGNVDRFHNEVGEVVTAAELNLWVSNLEATSGVDQINIIIDACHSGSFIDTFESGTWGLGEISGQGRVVVASTTSQWFAYAPMIAPGQSIPLMYFSNGFWNAVGLGQSLWSAFLSGRATVEAAGQLCGDYDYSCQRPWLDDTGDAWFDAADGVVAQTRGLGASFGGGAAPYIDWLTVSTAQNGRATIRVQVRDDSQVTRVWARLFAPSFEPPETEDGVIPVIEVPEVALVRESGDVFVVDYDGFTETGAYQVVVYAVDDEGQVSIPRWVLTGQQVYLPLVAR